MKRLLLTLSIALLASSPYADEKPPLATVDIFVSIDCPIANAYSPTLRRLYQEYTKHEIQFHLVYPEPTLTEAEIRKHRETYELPIPSIHDSKHLHVKKARATTTPEVAVYDNSGSLVYRGKIDNLFTDLGDRRQVASEHYLKDTLDKLLRGETLTFTSTEPVGCFIEDL